MTLEDTVRDLLREHYGDEIKITSIKSNSGTKPGENFGSIMVALTVTIETKNHNQSELNLMAKCLPTSEFIQHAFNVHVTFPKEADFYQVVIPEYAKLLSENNIEDDYAKRFPKFIGAKFGKLDSDHEATLLMENIKLNGYRLRPTSECLDLQHTEMVIKEIALFHSLGIALKFKKPDVYNSKIKSVGRSLKEGQNAEEVKKEINTFFDQVLDYLKLIEGVQDLVPRMNKVMKENFLYADMLQGYVPREPFSTLVHNDLWINNIMFKYDDEDKPISLKLVDFQRTKIGSPISDLILFLYVSTSLDVMKNNFDDLLTLYHGNLLESLTRLGVPTEGLSWENFQEELKYASEEVSMPVAMLRLLFIKVECDASEFRPEEFAKLGRGKEEEQQRHVQVVRDLARRGWI